MLILLEPPQGSEELPVQTVLQSVMGVDVFVVKKSPQSLFGVSALLLLLSQGVE